MSISPEVLASQAAYAARPYAARVETSEFSGTFRFHTLGEAIGYLEDQYGRFRRVVKNERYRAFDSYRSKLELPGGIEVAVREFLGDSLSSY